MGVGKLFTLIGLGLAIGLIIAGIFGVSTDLPPAVVGAVIGVVVALVAGHLGSRL